MATKTKTMKDCVGRSVACPKAKKVRVVAPLVKQERRQQLAKMTLARAIASVEKQLFKAMYAADDELWVIEATHDVAHLTLARRMTAIRVARGAYLEEMARQSAK